MEKLKVVCVILCISCVSKAYACPDVVPVRLNEPLETVERFNTGRGGKPKTGGGQVARPKGRERTPKVTKGAASLVFFYFGDSTKTTLAQETMELFRAMQDYEYIVLLKHKRVAGKYVVSQTALNKADEIATPTKANLEKYLIELAEKGYMIDLWIFSHGWKNGFRASKGTDGTHDAFTKDDIKHVREASGFKQLPIRMVYQVNCYGSSLIGTWRSIGAKTGLGARDVNFYPYEFARFATQWNNGKTFKQARDKADEITPRGPTNIYIRDIHAPQAKKDGKWSGCPFGYNVLGTTDIAKRCGKEYFTKVWKTPWKGDGKSTMRYTSWKIVAGDYDIITKNTTPKW